MSWLERELQITKLDDWYKVSFAQLQRHGGINSSN